MSNFCKPVRLSEVHRTRLEMFECGDASVDLWIRTKALPNQARGGSCTYLVFANKSCKLVGFFSLSLYSVVPDTHVAAKERSDLKPIRALLLCNLGVSREFQGQGVGRSMLQAAVRLAKEANNMLAISLVVAHPTSSRALQFLINNGFAKLESSNLSAPMLFLNLMPENKPKSTEKSGRSA